MLRRSAPTQQQRAAADQARRQSLTAAEAGRGAASAASARNAGATETLTGEWKAVGRFGFTRFGEGWRFSGRS